MNAARTVFTRVTPVLNVKRKVPVFWNSPSNQQLLVMVCQYSLGCFLFGRFTLMIPILESKVVFNVATCSALARQNSVMAVSL